MEYDSWLWGKKTPFCSLSAHMISVGACAIEFLKAPSTSSMISIMSRWIGASKENVIQIVSYIAALHDIGKAHPSFQKTTVIEDDSPPIYNFRHEQYGAELIIPFLLENGCDRRAAQLFSAAIRLHHQGKGYSDVHRNPGEIWHSIHCDLERRVRELFCPKIPDVSLDELDALGVTCTAVIILCDWVASSDRFAAESLHAPDDKEMLLRARLRARDVLDEFGLISEESTAYPRLMGFCSLWKTIPSDSMRPLQFACEQVSEFPALLTIIEAPMGEGKTETALYMASRLCEQFNKRGIYMALPTAATSNQMVGRVDALLRTHQSGTARLLHSMAWLLDEKSVSKDHFDLEDSSCAAEWLRPLRRGMLSENAVGTVDQAMAAALRIKYGFLRMAGLTEKVLIIDEIHAYDIFMSTIIARLLEWCRVLQIPVILLSATMQNQQKQRYLACYGIGNTKLDCAYPLITQVNREGQMIQTPVSEVYMHSAIQFNTIPVGSNITEIADLALLRAADGGCICVMMNTVRQAQVLYRELKDRNECQIMLFHARFTAKRRAEIEKACVDCFGKEGNRPARMILVCTQVVEQSLDVDFDLMLTQLAPMDLLLQRAGRVHRHAIHKRPVGLQKPVVDVLTPTDGESAEIDRRYQQIGSIYSPIVMRNTEKLLETMHLVHVPEDVRGCVEQVYRKIDDDEFVYDIADLYKVETTLPVAFEIVTQTRSDPIERAARKRLRIVLREHRILKRIANDLACLFDIVDSEDINRMDAGKLWDGEDCTVEGGVNHAEEV